ncbi:family 61 putative glycoside hydrolase [Xylogone sp. PMI_703]|nr:family 61 putative glycoside hydrolase [Xylogone sp. PMI_703]
MLVPTILSPLLFLTAKVSAHGAVTSFIINGVTYPGYQGYSPAQSPPTIERQWPSYDPILSVSDAAMTCNGGTSAQLNATLAAGQSVTAVWSQWTHQQGPVMVWMYSCDGPFTACDGKSKKWFKIDQMGMTAPPLTGTSWGTAVVMANLKWTSTVPAKLKPGNYLIRFELLALHQAYTPQFYPECAQLVITGSGTQTPSGSYLTSIPAYASASDPGVYIDIYTSTATTYTPPGPPVWS